MVKICVITWVSWCPSMGGSIFVGFSVSLCVCVSGWHSGSVCIGIWVLVCVSLWILYDLIEEEEEEREEGEGEEEKQEGKDLYFCIWLCLCVFVNPCECDCGSPVPVTTCVQCGCGCPTRYALEAGTHDSPHSVPTRSSLPREGAASLRLGPPRPEVQTMPARLGRGALLGSARRTDPEHLSLAVCHSQPGSLLLLLAR
jgi:hypothetical protein